MTRPLSKRSGWAASRLLLRIFRRRKGSKRRPGLEGGRYTKVEPVCLGPEGGAGGVAVGGADLRAERLVTARQQSLRSLILEARRDLVSESGLPTPVLSVQYALARQRPGLADYVDMTGGGSADSLSHYQ